MGSLSRKRFLGGGPRPKSNGSDTGPLRKIVGRCRVGESILEALVCGHLQFPKSDLMGETNAYRRRCKHCKAGRPVHFTGDPPTHMTFSDYDKVYEKKPPEG